MPLALTFDDGLLLGALVSVTHEPDRDVLTRVSQVFMYMLLAGAILGVLC